MLLAKPCAQCGKDFAKPKTLSHADWPKRACCSWACANLYKTGKPTAKRGRKYESRAKKIPCRICGQPTRYSGTQRDAKWGMVHCGSDGCREKSRRLKNTRISSTHKSDYASGERAKLRDLWTRRRISQEEEILAPWMISRGFEQQFKFLTGIKGARVPRCWWFDFAHPSQKICVEIDGSVHRLRADKDAHKDAHLKEKGWQVLRIPASLVRSDYAAVTLKIENYLT